MARMFRKVAGRVTRQSRATEAPSRAPYTAAARQRSAHRHGDQALPRSFDGITARTPRELTGG